MKLARQLFNFHARSHPSVTAVSYWLLIDNDGFGIHTHKPFLINNNERLKTTFVPSSPYHHPFILESIEGETERGKKKLSSSQLVSEHKNIEINFFFILFFTKQMKNKKKRIENHQYLKSHVRSILYWLGKFSSFMLLLLACLLASSLFSLSPNPKQSFSSSFSTFPFSS